MIHVANIEPELLITELRECGRDVHPVVFGVFFEPDRSALHIARQVGDEWVSVKSYLVANARMSVYYVFLATQCIEQEFAELCRWE